MSDMVDRNGGRRGLVGFGVSLGRSSLIRYLTVGVVNTCVGLSVIYVGIYRFNLADIPANVLGYAVGLTCSFVLNRYWTFASRDAPAGQFVRFLIVMGGAYLANIATVLVLIKAFAVKRAVAHALGVIPYTVAGYIGSRAFAFRRFGPLRTVHMNKIH